MWDLPRPGLEPVSPTLAGGFLTSVPPGKPPQSLKVLKPVLWPGIWSAFITASHVLEKTVYSGVAG